MLFLYPRRLKAFNFDNFINSQNSFLWPEYFIDYFCVRLVFTFPPKDSTLQYKKCVHLWNNFPCIRTLITTIKSNILVGVAGLYTVLTHYKKLGEVGVDRSPPPLQYLNHNNALIFIFVEIWNKIKNKMALNNGTIFTSYHHCISMPGLFANFLVRGRDIFLRPPLPCLISGLGYNS